MTPRILTWLRDFALWLFAPRLPWLTLLLTSVALLLVLRRSATEAEIRVVGMFLQLAGVSTVAIGLRQTRRMFDKPSILQLGRSWLAQIPPWRRNVVVAVGGVSAQVGVGQARAQVWAQRLPGDPFDQQLDAIARNVATLRDDLNRLQKDVDKLGVDHKQALDRESRQRSQAVGDVSIKLTNAQTGGIHISLAGLVWLSLGVIFTSIPIEIANWR